ncbi:MAG: DUF1207 domain-containing protein [Pirellulales bacterium]
MALTTTLSAALDAVRATEYGLDLNATHTSSGDHALSAHETAILPDSDDTTFDDTWIEEPPDESLLGEECLTDEWCLYWLPSGLIYHSYMAGVHEPHLALVTFHEGEGRTLWDATLGGRVGLLQYGNGDPARPAGYQLDFYGAAIARLDIENQQDLEATDYVFGFPLTWGDERLQFKLGYAHLSSHLGDELAVRVPATLADRVNYVRDSVVFGTSYYPYAAWRIYGEAGFAFHTSGGSEPLETQYGTELSKPGPSGPSGTPFLAINARLREEHDFGGDLAAQVGWMRRGILGQTMRLGVHYYNGKSSQFQFFNASEEHVGLGLWYDF